MVLVDMEVALGADAEVDQGVAGDLLQHVVEEADAGGDFSRAGAVEVDGDRNVGFLGLARDRGAAHGGSLLGEGLCIRRALGLPYLHDTGGMGRTRGTVLR